MSRAKGGHHWDKGDGRRGPRGARCDRCRRCGLGRAKKNGSRAYFYGDNAAKRRAAKGVTFAWLTEAPDCDPKRLQLGFEL